MSHLIDPAGKLLAHLPRLAMLQQGYVPAPINVEVDLSNRCSLGCEWCHFAYTHTRGPLARKRAKPAGAIAGGDLMDPDLARSLIHQLAKMGDVSVTWTGGGEPTLHPDFDRLVAYAATQGLKQGIYTHGGHISEARARLIKSFFTFAYVSLDAADAESYKRDKGVDRFAAACGGIRLLVAAEGDAAVGVGYLVTRENWPQARDAAELAQSLGASYVQYRPTILYDQETPNVVSEDLSWLPEAIHALELVQAEFGEFAVCDLDRFRMYRDWDGHGYPTCWWSALQTCITPNGKVWVCVNKREHPGAEIGDISIESFQEIWSRRQVAQVTGDCRTLCRGHVSNKALTEIMRPREHAEFV